MSIFILLLVLIFFIIPFLIYLLLYLFKKNFILSFFQLLLFDTNSNSFSKNNHSFFTDKLVFTPHPFLNWSLNPQYRNSQKEKVHTVEGFRKTIENESVLEYLESEGKDSFKIVCIGGSTTHCAEMDDFRDTWPALINKQLNISCKTTVINFGVGAYSSIQSQIRCLSYLNIVKPNLLIFYQAKNDLTPLMNGNLDEKKIFPDFQNIVGQYSERMFYKFPKYLTLIPLLTIPYFLHYLRSSKLGMLNIYKPKPVQNPVGMTRIDNDYINNITFRQKSIIDLCKQIDCKVLYIPEIVTEGIYRDLLFQNLYPTLLQSLEKEDNVKIFDVDSLMPKNNNYFSDKMHFTRKGNKTFAEILSNKIIKEYLS